MAFALWERARLLLLHQTMDRRNDAAGFTSCCGLVSCSVPLRTRSLDHARGHHYRGPWRLPGPDSHRQAALSLSLGYVTTTSSLSWRPNSWTHSQNADIPDPRLRRRVMQCRTPLATESKPTILAERHCRDLFDRFVRRADATLSWYRARLASLALYGCVARQAITPRCSMMASAVASTVMPVNWERPVILRTAKSIEPPERSATMPAAFDT
jgi:hypothetical protein